ncbi:MAG: hypothetical protein ABI947_06660 [Chloroflexota bacterium]
MLKNLLTREFFDALVYIIIIIGVVLSAWRIYGDFRRGPRWSDDSTEQLADLPDSVEPLGESSESEHKEDKP